MSDPGRSLVLAQVTGIKDNNLVYPSCYQCYSKVYRRQDADQNLWQCLKCKAVHTEADIYERYRLHLSITDDSTICDVTVFGTNVDELFGCSASHFKKSINVECDGTEGLLPSSLEEVFVGRFFLFGFKSSPIRRRDSEKLFRTPVTLAGVIAGNKRRTANACSQQSPPALVAYQMIPMQESVSKSDFPTVVQVLKRKILTRSSTNSQRTPDITREDLHHSGTTFGSTSRYSLCDQASGNLTLSYMQSSSRSSINMTYGQQSVLLSCDRGNSRVQLRHPKNQPEVGDFLVQQVLSNQTSASLGSQQLNCNVGYQRCNHLEDQMASIGNSFIKHCSLQDTQTMEFGEINFDQSIALASQQSGLANEVKGDCHEDIIQRATQPSANDQVDKRLVDTCHQENRDVHFDADDFNETFDPNEVDSQGSGSCVLLNPHRAMVAGSQCAVLPTDQDSPTTSPTTACDNLLQTLSDSCDSDSDSLLLLACSNGEGVGDQNLDRSTGRIPTRTLAPNRISDEDQNNIEECKNISEAGCPNPKDCIGSKGVSSVSVTSLSPGPQDTVIEMKQSQGRSNMDHVVTDATSGDFEEEELPFSEDLDAFLQDMSYSQAECSQEQLPNKRAEATAGVPLKENVLHTRNIREDSESCPLAKKKGNTQSRALCGKDVENVAGSSINQNIIATSDAGNQKVSASEQEVHPLENGSEDLFFSQDMSQQDSNLEIKSDISPSGSYGSTANSQSMNLFSGSELFSESYIDYEPDTKNGSCTEGSKQRHSVNNMSFERGKFDAISSVNSANQTGSTIDTSLTSVLNVLQAEERSEKKFTSRVLGQGTNVHSQHRDLCRTPLSEKLSSHVKNVQFAGFLTEAKDIAHIDLKMKTNPAPVARTRRKSCLKSGVSFVPSSVSPLQALQVSSPGIISTQMDLFSPSPEVVLRQQTTHRLNSTFHSTPVITNNTFNRVSENAGMYSICSSPDDSSDIIPLSAVRPSRLQLLRLSSKSEVTKAKHCPADKENVVTRGFEGIHGLRYSNVRTGHTKVCDGKSPTRELNQTVDSLQSQEMSQDLFSSAQSGDLFSDCSWEEDLDICKKLF